MTKNLSSTFLSHHLFSNFDEIILITKMLKKIKGLFENLFLETIFYSLYVLKDGLLRVIVGIQVSTLKETCLKLSIGG